MPVSCGDAVYPGGCGDDPSNNGEESAEKHAGYQPATLQTAPALVAGGIIGRTFLSWVLRKL